MSELIVKIPKWAKDFYKPARYKAVYGGRGSGKSWAFAQMLIVKHIENPNLRSLVLRELKKSLDESVKYLLEKTIQRMNASDFFQINDKEILSKKGSGKIMFDNLKDHTAESLKSYEDAGICWVEEAQTITYKSLSILTPTIRKEESEIWFTWNPKSPHDAVDAFFRGNNPVKNSIVKMVNYKDNKWFNSVMQEEMELCLANNKEHFAHIWLGEYDITTDALVFRNWKVMDFETPDDTMFYYGADWGYSQDPTVLIRCYIVGRKLFIDYEAYMVGCEIQDIPHLFFTIPESEKWPICADSSRPETISYMRKNGFPKMFQSTKGAKSVEEGIEWLKSFEIIVHPRCEKTIEELSCYSYKKDKATDKTTPILEDKNNHVMDSLRYACESVRRKQAQNKKVEINLESMRMYPIWR